MAVVIEELESGPLSKLYARSISQPLAKDKGDIANEARELYRGGHCQTTEDLYRLSTILSRSSDPRDLLLAHDCALALLVEGFRPSLRVLQASQEGLLRALGHKDAARVEISQRTKVASQIPILEQLEASWSEAAKRSSQIKASRVALAVVQ